MTPDELDEARLVLTRAFPLVNNHPDVAGVLRQADLLALLGPALASPFIDRGVTVVLAPEARGPILGSLVARELGTGLILARKANTNHPGADVMVTSEPTWRGIPQVFRARTFDLVSHDRVLVVDDWVTTGNSLRALRDIINRAGASYEGAAVLVDKAQPATIEHLGIHALVAFDELC